MTKIVENQKNENTHFDVVITDYKMPVMDGKELVKNISDLCNNDKEYHELKSIIIVGGAHTDEELNDMGADTYLRKPFTIDQLIEKIDSVIQ